MGQIILVTGGGRSGKSQYAQRTAEALPGPRAFIATCPDIDEEMQERIHALYANLGNWIGDPKDDAVRAAYEDWGRKRFRQGIPISEIVYTLILAKQHLRRYIRDHGLVEFSGDRVTPDELVPVQLHAVQELNVMVGEFFDRALYYLARGYEEAACLPRP